MSALSATVRSAMADAFARRASFWSQVAIMVLNDVAWVVFWVIFFRRVGEVRGWDIDSVLMLNATLTVTGGIVLGVLSNCRRIAVLVDEGAIDQVLIRPVGPLLHLLVRRIDAVNLGDVVFGVGLFTIIGSPSPSRIGIFVFAVACGTVLLTGFLVAASSIVFFTGRSQVGDLSLHAILLTAAYPAEVFTGYTRLLLFTAIPAALVSSVPSRLVNDFSWITAAGIASAAALFALIGYATFTTGLRRYTSGSGWSRG